jgi:hypothetical protein
MKNRFKTGNAKSLLGLHCPVKYALPRRDKIVRLALRSAFGEGGSRPVKPSPTKSN